MTNKELSIKTKEAFDKWHDTLPLWSDYEIELEILESIKMDDVYVCCNDENLK